MKKIALLTISLVLVILFTACGKAELIESLEIEVSGLNKDISNLNRQVEAYKARPTITPIPTPSPSPTVTPTPSTTASVSPGYDGNVYYIQFYDVVLKEIYTDDPKPPYGSFLPYGYLYEDEIPLNIAGVSEDEVPFEADSVCEDSEGLFDIEYKYLGNGIYEFTVPSPCYAIRFTSDIMTITTYYLYESLYNRFMPNPSSYHNTLKMYLNLHSKYIDVTWTDDSIEHCRTMQHFDYMNYNSYEEFSFSSFTSKFNSRPIVSFRLIPGEYLITYTDGSHRVIDFDKSGEYDFSYDGN